MNDSILARGVRPAAYACAALTFALALAACGQTGPLYLPQHPAGAAAAAPIPLTSTPAANEATTPTTP